MHNISYKKRANERVKKASFYPFSITMAILTLVAFIGAIVLFIAYPLFIDTSTKGIIDYFKFYFPLSNFSFDVLIIPIFQVLVLLGTIIFAILKIVKMFKPSLKRSGNVAVGFSAAFGMFFYLCAKELIDTIVSMNGNKTCPGNDIFVYAFIGVFALTIIYDIALACYGRKLWEKSGKKNNGLTIFTLVTCALAIAGGVIYVILSDFHIYSRHEYYVYLMDRAYPALQTSAIYSGLTSGVNIASNIFASISIITQWFILILAVKLVVCFIFDFCKIGADRNYVRGSNFFSHTSALKSAMSFLLAWFIFNAVRVLDAMIVAKEKATDAIKHFDMFYAIMFAIVFALSILCTVLALIDKKKAKDEEYSYNEENDANEQQEVEEIEQTEEVIDLTEEEVVEPVVEVPVVEQVAEPVEEVVFEPITVEPASVVEEPIIVQPLEQQEPIVEQVAEPVEEVVFEPASVEEEPIYEEEIFEPDYEPEIEEPKDKQAQNAGQPYPQYPYMAMPYPYGYPYPPQAQGYPQYPYMAMPYAYGPQAPYQQQQNQPSPTVICIPIQQPVQPQGQQMPYGQVPYGQMPYGQMPYGQPQGQQMPYGMPYGMPQGQPQSYAEQTPPQAPNVAREETLATEDFDEGENKPFFIERKTIEEKFNALPATYKKYYRDIMKYAENKEGVKRNKSTYGDSVTYGRECIIKIAIKQGKVICSFSLVNHEVKSMLKSGKSAREQLTTVKVVDAESYALAKQSVDMAYKLALDAKEARHQEQLRKRREARANKLSSK